MDRNIVLNRKDKRIYYENLDNIWIDRPYKFSIGRVKPPRVTPCFMHKDVEIHLVTSGTLSAELGDEQITVNTGEFVIASSMVPHRLIFNEDTTTDHLIVDSKYLYENGVDVTKYRFREKIDDEKMREFFRQLRIQKTTSFLRDLAIKGIVLQVVAYLVRYHADRIPDEEINTDLSAYGQNFEYARRAIDYISANIQNNLTVESISKHVGLTRYHFMRVFKSVTGNTVSDYINIVRCEHAKAVLSNGESSVTEAALSSGFNSLSYFSKIFQKHTGKLPSEYMTK